MSQIENLLEHEAKEQFKAVLIQVSDLEESSFQPLLDICELVTYKKGEIVINEGEIAQYYHFICKGIIRVYFYKHEKLIIERFEKENGLFGGNFTHIFNHPTTHVYEALEGLVLLRFKYSDLDALCLQSHAIERAYRIMIEIFHAGYTHRIYAFKSLTSEERYQVFTEQYGDIANRVPLKDTANYLSMTPETLSRIRAKFDMR